MPSAPAPRRVRQLPRHLFKNRAVLVDESQPKCSPVRQIICLCCRANSWFAPGVKNHAAQQRAITTGQQVLARYPTQCAIKIPRLVIVLLGGKIFCARCVPGAIVQRTQAQSAMMTIAGVKLGLFTDETDNRLAGVRWRQFR